MKGANANAIATTLVRDNGHKLDLNQEFSAGPGGGKTFIDEGSANITVAMKITNNMADPVKIALGANVSNIHANNAATIAYLGVDAILSEGNFVGDGGSPEKFANCAMIDSDRSWDEISKYIEKTPTRILGIALQSSKVSDGSPDSSNYASPLKTAWVSPWQKSPNPSLNLAQYIDNKSNSPQFVNVDFRTKKFPVIVSDEQYLILTIKPGTALDLTLNIGHQASLPQRFYRAIKKADEVLLPLNAASRG